jgi:hypothetical protein
LETVRIAQQRTDNECLAFALSWLYRVICASKESLFIDQNKKETILKRAAARAQELNLPYLASLNSLALAKHYLHHTYGIIQHGASPLNPAKKICTLPSKVWNYLNEAARIGTEHSLDELTSRRLLVTAACWELFGVKDLSSNFVNLSLKLHEDILPSDYVVAHCIIANQVLKLFFFSFNF